MTRQDSSKPHVLPIILEDCSTPLAWLNVTKQKQWSCCYIQDFWLETTQKVSSSLGCRIQLCPHFCLLSGITSTVIGPTVLSLQVRGPAVPAHRLLSGVSLGGSSGLCHVCNGGLLGFIYSADLGALDGGASLTSKVWLLWKLLVQPHKPHTHTKR